MDNSIENIIEQNMQLYGLGSYEELDKKTKDRLLQVQTVITNTEKKANLLIKELKECQLSKSSIISSDEISFSRKTLYNDDILNAYIDKALENSADYFGENKYKSLQNKYEELKELYQQVISNAVNAMLLANQVHELQQELMEKENRIEMLEKRIIDSTKTRTTTPVIQFHK